MVKKIIILSASLCWLGGVDAAFGELEEAIAHSDVVKVQRLLDTLDVNVANKYEHLEYSKALLVQAQDVAQKRKEQSIFSNGRDAAKFIGGLSLMKMGLGLFVAIYLAYKDCLADIEKNNRLKTNSKSHMHYERVAIGAFFGTTVAAGGLWLALEGWYCSRQQQLQESAEMIVQLLEEHTSKFL